MREWELKWRTGRRCYGIDLRGTSSFEFLVQPKRMNRFDIARIGKFPDRRIRGIAIGKRPPAVHSSFSAFPSHGRRALRRSHFGGGDLAINSLRPGPLVYFRLVYAVLIGIVEALNLHVAQPLVGVCPGCLERWNPGNHIHSEREPIDLVFDC